MPKYSQRIAIPLGSDTTMTFDLTCDLTFDVKIKVKGRGTGYPSEYHVNTRSKSTKNDIYVVGHVVIYQLFIESYSGRILVSLDINNNYPKYFFKK